MTSQSISPTSKMTLSLVGTMIAIAIAAGAFVSEARSEWAAAEERRAEDARRTQAELSDIKSTLVSLRNDMVGGREERAVLRTMMQEFARRLTELEQEAKRK